MPDKVNKTYLDKDGNEFKRKTKNVTKVIAYLENHDMKEFNKMAKELASVTESIKEMTQRQIQLQNEIQEAMNGIFKAADKVLTRVVETAEVITVADRIYERPQFNKKEFMKKIIAKWPKLESAIKAIEEECTSLNKVERMPKSKMKSEGMIGDVLKSAYEKIKTQVNKFLGKIDKILTSYDGDLESWRKELIADAKMESHNNLVSNSQKFLQE